MRSGVGLLGGLLACAAARLPAQAPSGVVRGVVSDSGGAPLQGAIVSVSAQQHRAFTRTDGGFALSIPPTTRAVVVARLIGYRPDSSSVAVRAGETTTVSFRLARAPMGPLPPRIPRPAGADSAPAGADKIDDVARVAKLPRLRPTPARGEQRELRLWVGFGISIPMQLLRLTTIGNRTTGELYHWIHQPLPRPDEQEDWKRFVREIPTWLRREHECPAVAVDTVRWATSVQGVDGSLVVACRVRPRREPDWSAVLRELESHQIWTLPDESEAPPSNVISLDGATVIVEAWDGRRYRSYSHGNPDGTAWVAGDHAEAILMKVISLMQH